MNRKSISPTLRFDIFKRDRFICQYCGKTPPLVILEIDHIIPVSSGGQSQQSNLLTSCFECNQGKGSKSLDSIPVPLTDQIEEKKLRFKQIAAFNRFLIKERNNISKEIDEIGIYWFNKFKKEKDKYTFGDARIPTIKTFLNSLPKVEILDAIDISFGRFIVSNGEDYKLFKYFCGVCWNKIRRSNGQD